MRRHLFLLITLFCIGIILGRFVPVSPDIWALLTGGAVLLNFLLFLFSKSDLRRVGISLLLCACFMGAFWYDLSQYPASMHKELDGQNITGEGMVITYPRDGEYSLSLVIRVNELSSGGNELPHLKKLVLKVTAGQESDFPPGTIISFRGEMKVPVGSRNPGDFDYQEYLANQGIFYEVGCTAVSLQVLSESSGLRGLAASGRERIRTNILKLLPSRESGLLLGFLFGDTTGISKEDWEIYQRAGVLHLFAISGLHVAFMLGVAYFLLSFFMDGPISRVFCGTAVLIIYYFLIGWKVSFVRASIMVFLGMLAVLTGRKRDIYTSAALAVGVILIINPGELFQMGFQMSFAATVGIVYYAAYLKRLGLGRFLSSALAAQITTMPLIAYYFNLISIVAPPLNVVAVMVSTLIASLGLVGALLSCLVPIFAKPFILAAGFLLYLLSEFILNIANCSWAAIVVPTPSLYYVFIAFAIILFLPQAVRLFPYMSFLAHRFKTVVTALIIVVIIIACWPQPAQMEVIFLDVGQGDSVFIRTPRGHTLLVDGGGTPGTDYSIGKRVVRPFLLREGMDKIDMMVMSHNHLDHSEGLLELLPFVKVGSFLMPPREENNEIEEKILKHCREESIPVLELVSGEKVLLEKDVYMEVLHPQATDEEIGNNHSLVLRLVYRDVEWLLTGDIENKAIEDILARGESVRADVLKLPHHGSISSCYPEFYQAVAPRAVVVSVGFNLYNQPHPLVREYFVDRSIPYYSTKEKGAVLTKSDGRSIQIKTMNY